MPKMIGSAKRNRQLITVMAAKVRANAQAVTRICGSVVGGRLLSCQARIAENR